jgi:tetratricopeptide (TPR) repeat protein
MQAAACYRELGDQEKRRECLEQVLKDVEDVKPISLDRSLAVAREMAAYRDMATYLLGNSYYEQKRWTEAAQLYRQMHGRLNTQFSERSEEYNGQKQYLGLLNTGLDWCAARQAEESARFHPQAAATQAKGQVTQ